MEFAEFTQKAWSDHGEDAQAVADRLAGGLELVTELAQLPALAGLIVHVRGEHLGQWDEGLEELEALTRHKTFDADTEPGRSIQRSKAILHRCRGDEGAFESCMQLGRSQADHPPESDHARVYAVVASTLAGQDRIEEAMTAFQQALDFTTYGPVRGDPAALALAVTGNNLACALEEKADRSSEEVELMKLAAETGRHFWEIAGDWKNVERAEYRLGMTMIAAGEARSAVKHAEQCLAVCQENEADALELFFAHEVLARASHADGSDDAAAVAHARCVELLDEQDEDMKSYCSSCLEQLTKAIGVA